MIAFLLLIYHLGAFSGIFLNTQDRGVRTPVSPRAVVLVNDRGRLTCGESFAKYHTWSILNYDKHPQTRMKKWEPRTLYKGYTAR